MVKKGVVSTPHAEYCLPGITRATVSLIRLQLGNYQNSEFFMLPSLQMLIFFMLDEITGHGSCGERKPGVT